MRIRGLKTWLGAAVLVVCGCNEFVGCEPVLRGEMEQLEFARVDAVLGPCTTMRERGPMLVGSRLCPTIECVSDIDGCGEDDERLDPQDVALCYERDVTGSGSEVDGCLVVDDVGEVVWSFTPRGCPANAFGYAPGPERLTIPGVVASEVQAHLDAPGDALARRDLDPGPEPEFPADAQLGPGVVAHTLADHPVHLAVVLRHPAHEQDVGWNPMDWTPVVTAGPAVPLGWDAFGVLTVALEAGEEITVGLSRGTDELVAGTIRGVAQADIVELEVVLGYLRAEDDDYAAPAGARGVLRAADGVPVYGGEVAWEVTEGAFAVWRDADRTWGPDYVALMDEEGRGCHAPPERPATYNAELVARFGDLETVKAVRWTERPPEQSTGEKIGEFFGGDDHKNSDLCQGPGFPTEGCGSCRGGGGPAPALALLALLVGLRRRRSISLRSHASSTWWRSRWPTSPRRNRSP